MHRFGEMIASLTATGCAHVSVRALPDLSLWHRSRRQYKLVHRLHLTYRIWTAFGCRSTPSLALMKFLFIAIIFLLQTACVAGECRISESAILGDWETASISAPFAVISLEKEGKVNSFNSWRHERPDYMDATWQYQDCVVRIVHANEVKLNAQIFVISASRDRMVVRAAKGSEFEFRRIKPPR